MYNNTETVGNHQNRAQGRFQQQQGTKAHHQHMRVPYTDYVGKRNDDDSNQKHGQAQNAQNHYHDQQRGQNRQNKGRDFFHGNGNGNYRKNHRGNNQQYGPKRSGNYYSQAKAQINSGRSSPEPTAIKENPKKIENVQAKVERQMHQKVMQEENANSSLSDQSSYSSTPGYQTQSRMSMSDSCLNTNNSAWMKPIWNQRFNHSEGQIAMTYQPPPFNDFRQQHMHYQNRVTYTKEYVNQNYAQHKNAYNNDFGPSSPPKEFYSQNSSPRDYQRPVTPPKVYRQNVAQQDRHQRPVTPPKVYYNQNRQQSEQYHHPGTPPKDNRPSTPPNSYRPNSPQNSPQNNFRRHPNSPNREYRRYQYSPRKYRGYGDLTRQINDKLSGIQLSTSKFHHKAKIMKEIWENIRRSKIFQEFSLHMVGSTVTGFGLENCDVDVCLATKQKTLFDRRSESLGVLSWIKQYLELSSASFSSLQLINAKVPILRFYDSTGTIEIDLNFNNDVGVRNTHLLRWYSYLDERVTPLIILVKLWAKAQGINDAHGGTISSYSLVLMCIHFLQYACSPAILPCLHRVRPDKFNSMRDVTGIDVMEKLNNIQWKSENTQSMGELFTRFMDYYSNFDYAKYAISVRTGGIIPIEQCKAIINGKNDQYQWVNLCIEEPFELTNTARSIYDKRTWLQVHGTFRSSLRRLKNTFDLKTIFEEKFFNKPPPQPSQHQTKVCGPLHGIIPAMSDLKFYPVTSYVEQSHNKSKRAESNSSIDGSSTASI